jgi:hypothetical protein
MKTEARSQFLAQRAHAEKRGVPFRLTFREWEEWWQATGHYNERGSKKHQYVMARKGDKGAYELGNIECITADQNRQDCFTNYYATPSQADYLMTQIRKSRGLSLGKVAAAVECDPGNLSRVERGDQPPKRELVRKLWSYYGGAVPYAAIADPAWFAENGAGA